MKVYHRFSSQEEKSRAITLGVFDGVHRGHAKLIKKLCQIAERLNLTSSIITFDDHPHGTLSPAKRPPRLSLPEQCLQQMELLGVDEVFLINFTTQLASQDAESFVKKILVDQLNTRHIVVGQDFVFGKQAKGDVNLLRRLGRDLGFNVTVVPPLIIDGHIVSSSKLRKKIALGHISQANEWLGWTYALHGVVERGEGRGSQLGIPTANLRTTHEIVPSPGTYAVLAHINRRIWPGLCHIGNRPTFHQWGPETIETYIPGWKGRLYGKRLEVHFLKKLRKEKRFQHADDLVEQVIKDWKKAQQYWPEGMTVCTEDLAPLISQAKSNLGDL